MTKYIIRADSGFAPCQWETALLYNDVSHWLGAIIESALHHYQSDFYEGFFTYARVWLFVEYIYQQ